jgi:hypothetical protein
MLPESEFRRGGELAPLDFRPPGGWGRAIRG